ncbi:MAG TPA: ATP-binding protein [Candidatus Binatia bacterium]|nr:ATP-binding protein [Candidatus Binatia bacterium]
MAVAPPPIGIDERASTGLAGLRRYADLATRNALRIALLYVGLGFLWILLSDRAVDALVADPAVRSVVSTVKGWGYVAATGFLLFVLVRRDLARELRIQRALRASERRLRSLLEAVDLAAVILDRDGRVAFANDFLARLLGTSRQALIGSDWFELAIPEESRLAQRDLFERIMAGTATAGRSEGEILTPTGPRRIGWHCAPLRDGGGAMVGLVAIGEDLTERRRLEAHVQRVERMEAIGQLAGGIAHDFNNLLTVIGGHADLILACVPVEAPVATEAAEIRAAVERASGLTRQLLAVSRRQILEPRPVDLAATVGGLEPMLRRLLGERIELVVERAPGAWVEADPAQLEQVVLNLAVNARDAMPDGGRLTIAVGLARAGSMVDGRSEPLETEAVLLRVQDTGVGMSPEVAARAFEPFYTTKPAGVGTGLGLATVYGIVRQSGGEVFLETAPGAGATFTIVLPRIDPPTAEPAAAEAPAAARRPGTILLVEDEAAVRALVRRILEGDGYAVVEAADGGAAEAAAADLDAPPDLLVSDVVLPGLTGPELARRLRARWPDLRIVFVSGYPAPEAGLDGAAEGAAFLAKPFSPDQLRAAVATALGDHRTGARDAS